jgi:two-component system CheB/CheR fusion protein
MRAASPRGDAVERAREIVERQSRHMARLLDDLLDVSRITHGAIELRKEDLDLREVIRGALEAMNPLLEENKTQLRLNISDQILPVRGDSARIQQVIVNLLSNAVRYSPAGGWIELSAHSDEESIVLQVKDQGRGISPTMLTEIFELFVQDHQDIERSRGGLGIGLTLVRQIVDLHGGKVEAISQGPGTGSEFVVKLPRQPHALLFEKPVPQPQFVHRRVLIVEDQDDARAMLRAHLESVGHFVIEAGDGISAVETVQREHPDVALVDIGVPLLSGYEIARTIRDNPMLDDIVLIALTGYGMDSDVEAAKKAGFDMHVTKPADPQLIEELLTRPLRRQKAS